MDTNLLLNIHDTVPVFTAQTIEGETIEIKTGLGRIVLLNFFIIRCPHCRHSFDFFRDRLAAWSEKDSFQLLCVGRDHTKDELAEFRERNGYLFPMVPDPERKIYGLFANLKVPRNFLLSPEGQIVYLTRGFNVEEYEKMAGFIREMTGRIT